MVNAMTKSYKRRGHMVSKELPMPAKSSMVSGAISFGMHLPLLLVSMMTGAILSSAFDSDESDDGGSSYMDPRTGRVHMGRARRAYYATRGECPKYPSIEPGEDGALSAYRSWDKNFRDWVEENELDSLLQQDSGLPPDPSGGGGGSGGELLAPPEPPDYPAMPDAVPEQPHYPIQGVDCEDNDEALSAAVDAYQEELSVFLAATTKATEYAQEVHKLNLRYQAELTAYNKEAAARDPGQANYKYRKWRLKQKALRMKLKRAVVGSISLSAAVDRVDRGIKNCGSMVYHEIIKEIMSMYDDDAVSATQNEVASRIQPIDDTAGVKTFITEYRTFYRDDWCSLFVPTSETAKPWLVRVPESLLVSKFMQCLPSSPEWHSFRMANEHLAFKEDLLGLFGLVLRKCNIILRSQGPSTKVSSITTNNGKTKEVTGPHLTCKKCVKSGIREGPQTQHTPLWDGCPHHAEWKAKQSKRNNNKKTQRVKGDSKGSTKGGPSKDRPCSLCGSDSHWANKCPKRDSNKDKRKGEEEVEDAGTDMAAIATCVADAVTGALAPLTQTLVQQQERIMAAVAPRPPPHRQLANAPWGESEYGGSQGSGYFHPGPNSPPGAQG